MTRIEKLCAAVFGPPRFTWPNETPLYSSSGAHPSTLPAVQRA